MEVSPILDSADARWHPHAACAHAGPDRFYKSPHGELMCGSCPASEPCLWAALALEQVLGYRHGIWGGTTPARRARIAAGLPGVDLTGWYLAVVDSWVPGHAHGQEGCGRAA